MDGPLKHVEPSPAARTWGARAIAALVLLACATIFAWSGIGKLQAPQDAVLFVRALVPSIAPLAALTLVKVVSISELVLAIWLAAGAFTPRARPRWSLSVFAGVMLVMGGLLALAISRGFEGSCGCFGSGGAGASTAIMRTLALPLVAGLGIVYAPASPRPARSLT